MFTLKAHEILCFMKIRNVLGIKSIQVLERMLKTIPINPDSIIQKVSSKIAQLRTMQKLSHPHPPLRDGPFRCSIVLAPIALEKGRFKCCIILMNFFGFASIVTTFFMIEKRLMLVSYADLMPLHPCHIIIFR